MTAEQPIVDGVQNLLVNATAVTASVSTRIYDTMAPQNATLPFIIHTVLSDPTQFYFDRANDIIMEIQLDVFGKIEAGTKAVRAIADNVYAALNMQGFTATGYSGISMLCTNRGNAMDQDTIIGGRTQQDAWRQMQTYRIYGTGS